MSWFFDVDCSSCDSENVRLIEETNCEGTPNKHYECLDCGTYFTQVTWVVPPLTAKEDVPVKEGEA